jgi:hypothetical protein
MQRIDDFYHYDFVTTEEMTGLNPNNWKQR